MNSLRWPLRLYVLGVLAVGPLAMWYAARDVGLVTLDDLVLFVILLALATVAQLWPVHLTPKMKVTVEDTATFAGALLLGPFLSMLVAGASRLALRPGARFIWYESGFNASVSALGTGAAAVVYAALAGPAGSLAANPLAIGAAAIAKYLVHTGLVDLAVAIQLHRDPLGSWWQVHRRDLPHEAVLYLLGVLAALSASGHPWVLGLFAAPMALVLINLRQTARLREQTRSAILELADLVDLRDPYTHGHSQRTAEVAERLARHLHLQPSQVELVRAAARVHDIGKIGTEDHVLLKRGPLDRREEDEMHRHSEFGAQLISLLPEFWEGAALVLSHHERPDGRGYPRGLRESELPLEASVIAVADAYDAMTNDRPYRRALGWAEAKAEFLRHRGAQWDARVVDALIEMIEQERRALAPRPQVPAATTA